MIRSIGEKGFQGNISNIDEKEVDLVNSGNKQMFLNNQSINYICHLTLPLQKYYHHHHQQQHYKKFKKCADSNSTQRNISVVQKSGEDENKNNNDVNNNNSNNNLNALYDFIDIESLELIKNQFLSELLGLNEICDKSKQICKSTNESNLDMENSS
ncbi:hypothetical protein ACTA71_002055 [Dictyostelium dimigraforme]